MRQRKQATSAKKSPASMPGMQLIRLFHFAEGTAHEECPQAKGWRVGWPIFKPKEKR